MGLWQLLSTIGCSQAFSLLLSIAGYSLASLHTAAAQHAISSLTTNKRGQCMMFLAARALAKSYGAINVLDEISFVMNAGDRVGLVGSNGVGKSTLLKILVGQEEAEAGTFSFAPLLEVGYLPQTTPDFYGRSIQDLILESVGNLRQSEERMRQIEVNLTTASGEQATALLEEYGQVSTRFQDRGGYELDYKIDTVLDGLGISYLPRAQEVQTLSG